MATTAERLDPNSPHYDAAFADLRRKAYAAFAAHESDMATDPEYRAEATRFIASEDRRIKRALRK